ncbi:MAG: DUF3089 domain-containing protein [Lentisphaeria bacterium]|nr:DUF3089 domain-containing protein [Lentisphaeria bacterium]
MRNVILVLMFLVSAVLAGAGCRSPVFYDDSRNWVIRNNDLPAFSSAYDVFYLYPSQQSHTSGDTLNWFQEGVTEQIRHYARNMMSDLTESNVRIFSPFIPQLGHDNYCRLMEERHKSPEEFRYDKSALEPAIRHAVIALKYYLKHYNRGLQPYVLIGQGQGAVILYEAMKQVSDVSPAKGFAAAFFQGIPDITVEKITADFGSRGIGPAAGRYDFGVIAVFNTALPDEKHDPLPGAALIDPLTWKTGAVSASAKQNPGSIFWLNPGGKLRKVRNYCGTVADPEKGVVVLSEIQPRPPLKLSEKVFMSDAWGIFSTSVSRNAGERIHEYLFRIRLMNAK